MEENAIPTDYYSRLTIVPVMADSPTNDNARIYLLANYVVVCATSE